MSLQGRAHAAWQLVALVLVMVLGAALLVVGLPAHPARAETANLPGVPQTVSTDGLPTWQINGVVWQQAIVGNTVYAVGNFTKARPPGVAVGGAGEIAANYIFAYDITTGNRVPGFSHQLNGQANAVMASPDGSRIYVGGDFTTVDGVARTHIAAFATATGALVTSFTPVTSSRVAAIAVTSSAVYVGGFLKSASSKPSQAQQARSYLAAFRASDGALLPWAPVASDTVMSLVASPDGSRIIVGGHFLTLSGSPAPGLGAVDATTGATLPFEATARITSGGAKGGITSLRTDGTQVYGTGYAFGTGRFEGTFGIDPTTGHINFVNDCHGDTYDTFPSGPVLYAVSHTHSCEWIGAFKNTSPSWTMHYGTAYTTYPTGTNTGPDDYGWNYSGLPDSSVLHWFPTITPGTFTGQGQAGWSLTGNSSYIAIGGEFPFVNSVAQQGLVRFAVPSIAPNKLGAVTSTIKAPAVASISSGTVKVSWTAGWDRDNTNLTYNVLRDGSTTPIHTVTTASNFWTLPSMAFTDTGLAPGSTHTYRIQSVDPFNNKFTGPVSSTVTVSSTAPSAYAQDVLNDGASSYWRLGEPSGTTSLDYAGPLSLTRGSGVAGGATGAIAGDADGAATFSGTSNGSASTGSAVDGSNLLTVEAWVKTTSSAGGKIIGFGNAQTGSSSTYDRQLYVDSAGRVQFGVNGGGIQVVRSPSSIRDGSYHHVVGTLSPSGISLFVDGTKVASNAGGTTGQSFSGYWRVGGDNLSGWPNRPSSNYLAGTIDDVAVYPTALTLAQVQRHYVDSGRTLGGGTNVPPHAAIASPACTNLTCTFDGTGSTDPDGTVASYLWTFPGGSTSTSGKPSFTFPSSGTYQVSLKVTDNGGLSDTATISLTVAAANLAPVAAIATPICTGLTCSFDGSGSADADGTIASYAWSYDGGGSDTGPSASHTFGTAGTHTATLTVTDDHGATDSATATVTLTTAPTTYAQDSFGRTVASGWGTADQGGAWTTSKAVNFSVDAQVGSMMLTAPGANQSIYLDGVSSTSTDTVVTISTDKLATGGGIYANVLGRKIAGVGEYRLKARITAGNTVGLTLVRTASNGAETTLRSEVIVPGLTYALNAPIRLRLQVDSTDPATTSLKGRAWRAGSAEPSTWAVTATDTTAALQAAGAIGLNGYLSGTATNAPVAVRFDDLASGPVA